MFKVISSEFKKMFAKPGIYILAILLATILILGVFVYNPKVVETSSITLNGTDFLSKYTDFIGDDATDKTKGVKVKADAELQSSIKNILNYRVNYNDESHTIDQHIYLIKNELDKNLEAFLECQRLSDGDVDQNYINLRHSKVRESVESLNLAISDALTNSTNGCYALIMTNELYSNYTSLFKDIVAWSNMTEIKKEDNGIDKYVSEYQNKYETKLNELLNSIIYPEISDQFINDFTNSSGETKLNTLNARLDYILDEINLNLEEANSNQSKRVELSPIMDKLANDYVNTINTYVNLIKYELISNAYGYVSTIDQLQIKSLSDISEYNANSLKVKYNFLFKNGKSETDYSNPLTIGITSYNETNAYDYSYFVLRLFSFVIIIFAVMSVCHTIAGEIKEGSMRYLAIRPISRTSILIGKLLAILITSAILTLFSAIISLGVGFAVYETTTAEILTIFNGNLAVVMNPLVMIGIYILSLIVEITIYSSIALMLSCLIKSDLLSVTILIALLLINTLLPVFINATNSWLTFYPFSHINLYTLFGSSLYSQGNDFFNIILGAKVYINTNIILTSIVSLVLIIIPIIISIRVFKSKEL